MKISKPVDRNQLCKWFSSQNLFAISQIVAPSHSEVITVRCAPAVCRCVARFERPFALRVTVQVSNGEGENHGFATMVKEKCTLMRVPVLYFVFLRPAVLTSCSCISPEESKKASTSTTSLSSNVDRDSRVWTAALRPVHASKKTSSSCAHTYGAEELLHCDD